MPLDTIESFIYPTDVQLDCSKDVKIYMRGAPTCFGFSQPSSGSHYMCFAKVISINTLRTGDADLHFYVTTVQDG